MTSGWHEKVVSLTHRTWNVRVYDKTEKKVLVPDGTSNTEHLFTANRYLETLILMQICICTCKKNSESQILNLLNTRKYQILKSSGWLHTRH